MLYSFFFVLFLGNFSPCRDEKGNDLDFHGIKGNYEDMIVALLLGVLFSLFVSTFIVEIGLCPVWSFCNFNVMLNFLLKAHKDLILKMICA